MWFSGDDVKTIAATLKVSPSLIYEDQDYIENHADELMKNYIIRTVPHVISKSLYQIDLANKQAIKIMNDANTDNKLKISAALAVSKTARDVVEIIAGNKGIVDKALELDQSLKSEEQEREEEQESDELLSGNSTQTEESTKDPQARF